MTSRDAILIAAHNRDSYSWDIAKDIADFACAGQFAHDLIEESNPPHFSQSGLLIVADVIISLIMTHQQDWTAVTLLEALLAEPHEIAERIALVHMNSGHLLKSSDPEGVDKTLLGIMGTIWSAALNSLRPLAWAWADAERHPRFSVTEWLDDDYKGPRILLLQSSFEYAQLSSLVAGGILKRIASKLSDPAIKPDPKRRVAMFLDEFYMLSEIKNFAEALAVGREKGLVAVLGFQSYAQLVEKYGDQQANILWDMFQIKVLSRQVPGEATAWLSTIMGTRKISVLLPNRARGPADALNVERHEDYSTFAPARLAGELGVFEDGKQEVRGLVYFKGNAYRVNWPFTIWGKKRQGYVVAEWMSEIPKSAAPQVSEQL